MHNMEQGSHILFRNRPAIYQLHNLGRNGKNLVLYKIKTGEIIKKIATTFQKLFKPDQKLSKRFIISEH